MYKKQYLFCILQYRKIEFSITTLLYVLLALRKYPVLKSQCKIVLATSEKYSLRYWLLKKVLFSGIDFEILKSPVTYMLKLDKIFKTYSTTDFKYFVKCDEDILVSSDSLYKILQNSETVIESGNALLTTLNLSTGIPSWNYFAKQLFDKSFYDQINKLLANDSIPEQIWGNDYKVINSKIRSFDGQWNENKYWEEINQLNYDYKGIHPVRTSIQYSELINDSILLNFKQFISNISKNEFAYVNNRYFCNSFFVINYTTYFNIINNKDLFVDNFDEVPINKHKNLNNLAFCFLEESLAVHISYNSVYHQKVFKNGKYTSGDKLEYYYLLEYQKKILKEIKPSKIYIWLLLNCNHLNFIYFKNISLIKFFKKLRS
ncbi:MAG: hypothetical protein FD136_1194 [Chitinophagaceae bacterium]|nr:MAG: hypothetical protein FD136_1194 [Chitinophagaceae bacterium]